MKTRFWLYEFRQEKVRRGPPELLVVAKCLCEKKSLFRHILAAKKGFGEGAQLEN